MTWWRRCRMRFGVWIDFGAFTFFKQVSLSYFLRGQKVSKKATQLRRPAGSLRFSIVLVKKEEPLRVLAHAQTPHSSTLK